MKVQILLLALAVLVICTACATIVAAPAATPTPIQTPKPIATPMLEAAPDLLREELEGSVWVCLLTPYQYLANVPVGKRVGGINFNWVVSGADMVHTIQVPRESWSNLSGYETFHFVSTYKLSRRVWVDIRIGKRTVTLYPTVKDCPPPLEQTSL